MHEIEIFKMSLNVLLDFVECVQLLCELEVDQFDFQLITLSKDFKRLEPNDILTHPALFEYSSQKSFSKITQALHQKSAARIHQFSNELFQVKKITEQLVNRINCISRSTSSEKSNTLIENMYDSAMQAIEKSINHLKSRLHQNCEFSSISVQSSTSYICCIF